MERVGHHIGQARETLFVDVGRYYSGRVIVPSLVVGIHRGEHSWGAHHDAIVGDERQDGGHTHFALAVGDAIEVGALLMILDDEAFAMEDVDPDGIGIGVGQCVGKDAA